MNDQYFDALLNIKTMAQNNFSSSLYYHRYEPTPYSALEQLFNEYEMDKNDYVVDFGCGKGRLIFYINYYFHSRCTGVEMDEKLYKNALENQQAFFRRSRTGMDKIHFQCSLAEEYKISQKDNKFYFFNPFTAKIFMKVVNHILQSIEETPREADIILYYPSENYIYYLENETAFELVKEIRLEGLYEKNVNERFLIYRFTP